ncbi:hypothetical protein A3844_10165 [Paenibacillus helianthi]|uniref:Purine nucleoside phosphorylase n=1 Tax=Paenibacillus helianthi TaxID=1349432 RepID=A0ABX3ES42_9BACL|nr:MTAP family purine nucleoside phosphorylase [Paenibacillus helianthi]OKP87761.1 hypothetical protein A3844_10165 [Paenibacillus helianthi]
MDNAVGIIGGSGLYQLLEHHDSFMMTTPYGDPSSAIQSGVIAGKQVYFIARHGIQHEIPPHKVNYRANIQAFYNLGVRKLIATHAVGSLNPAMVSGDFVLSHQFVNRTWGRQDTFFDGPETVHVSASDPFCEDLRFLAEESLISSKYRFHNEAVMLVIQGPRFNTRAENRIYYHEGNDVISMTGYPEAVLARERGICYMSLGVVTDMACVLNSQDHPDLPTTHEDVVNNFAASVERMTAVLGVVLTKMEPEQCRCACAASLKGAHV